MSLYICLFTIHITVHIQPWTGHFGNVIGCHGEASTCAHNVYQVLTSPQLKGPGYGARMNIELSFVREERKVCGMQG